MGTRESKTIRLYGYVAASSARSKSSNPCDVLLRTTFNVKQGGPRTQRLAHLAPCYESIILHPKQTHPKLVFRGRAVASPRLVTGPGIAACLALLLKIREPADVEPYTSRFLLLRTPFKILV